MKKLLSILVLFALSLTAHAQTYQVNNLLANGVNNVTKVDLTALSTAATYVSGANVYSFYPTVGFNAGDHQRAQNYVSFVPSQNATISETGISINSTMNSGFARTWAVSTYFNLNDYIDVNGSVYVNTQAGTSASSGNGPSGTGSGIADGNAIWNWVCNDQCNAKIPLFISATAGSSAGKVWAADVDLVLQSGWNGQFAAAFESDITNNSGANCGGCQNFFATGDPGANTVQAAYSAYDPSSTLNSWVNGFQVAGTKAYSNAAFYDFAFGGQYGLLLAGGYGTAGIMMAHDFAQMRFGSGNISALNRWRIISNINGTNDGSLTIQHSTDNFGSNFLSTLTANTDGSISLPPVTTASLGACSSVKEAVVSDGILTPTYRQTATGGGTSARKVFCDGGGTWVYD